jgi:hypothetical protein
MASRFLPKRGKDWHGIGKGVGLAKKGEITREGTQLYLLIFKRDERRRKQEEILIKGGQEPPSSLNFAATTLYSGVA